MCRTGIWSLRASPGDSGAAGLSLNALRAAAPPAAERALPTPGEGDMRRPVTAPGDAPECAGPSAGPPTEMAWQRPTLVRRAQRVMLSCHADCRLCVLLAGHVSM